MAKEKAEKSTPSKTDAVKKKGFEISVDKDTVKTAMSVAKKVFKRKKRNRDLSSPRG